METAKGGTPTAELRARPVKLFTARPFVISSAWRSLPRRMLRALGFAGGVQVIHVEVRDGKHVGRGEARPSARWGESVESALASLALAGLRLDALPPGERAARAALDAALHDLDAQRAGVPVWKMLGLRRGGPPTSFTLSLDNPDAMARVAEREAGRFRVLKLKLGGGDGLDVERVKSVRRVTALPLRVDANEGWGYDEAVDLIPQLVGLGVEFVEQPLPAGDAAGERLRERSPLPIFVDEDCRVAEDVAGCARRAHGVNIKLSKCGGIGEALRCVAAARACGLRAMIGCMIESSLGIAAAAQISSRFDYADIDSNFLLERDPFAGVELVDGVQLPADLPGLGVRPRA